MAKPIDITHQHDDTAVYRYEVSRVDDSTWMVRRYDADNTMTESLLRAVSFTNPADAIRVAVARGSWA